MSKVLRKKDKGLTDKPSGSNKSLSLSGDKTKAKSQQSKNIHSAKQKCFPAMHGLKEGPDDGNLKSTIDEVVRQYSEKDLQTYCLNKVQFAIDLLAKYDLPWKGRTHRHFTYCMRKRLNEAGIQDFEQTHGSLSQVYTQGELFNNQTVPVVNEGSLLIENDRSSHVGGATFSQVFPEKQSQAICPDKEIVQQASFTEPYQVQLMSQAQNTFTQSQFDLFCQPAVLNFLSSLAQVNDISKQNFSLAPPSSIPNQSNTNPPHTHLNDQNVSQVVQYRHEPVQLSQIEEKIRANPVVSFGNQIYTQKDEFVLESNDESSPICMLNNYEGTQTTISPKKLRQEPFLFTPLVNEKSELQVALEDSFTRIRKVGLHIKECESALANNQQEWDLFQSKAKEAQETFKANQKQQLEEFMAKQKQQQASFEETQKQTFNQQQAEYERKVTALGLNHVRYKGELKSLNVERESIQSKINKEMDEFVKQFIKD